jgi:tetratricopeptide (TPR) repeat protein
MKKIINYIFAAGMMMSAASCSFTDLEPTDKVGDKEIFSSVTTLEQALTGAYSKMSMRTTISVSAVLSDDVYKGGQNGGAGDDSYQWTYSASTGDHNTLWSDYYSTISMANRVISGSVGVTPANDSEAKVKNNCIGSALFIRAYTYFDLLRFFSDFEKKEGYGIPYSKEPIVLETLGRNTVAECFADIKEDLETAISLMSQVAPDDPAYASQAAAKALLARVYLYERNYDKAYEYASGVLAQNPIATLGEYAHIWSDESNKEVIFELKRLSGEESIGTIFFSADNSSSFEPSTELINSFTDDDIRLQVFIGDGVDRDGVAVKRVNKYKGTSENVGLADQKMLRSSEMLLIMAEAKAYTDLAEGNKLLNRLRAARIEGWEDKEYATKEALLDEILLERRRELCYEGHRFFDMRRFNLPIYKPMIDKTLDVNDHHRIQPIPLSEMQGNPVIAKQQNSGY